MPKPEPTIFHTLPTSMARLAARRRGVRSASGAGGSRCVTRGASGLAGYGVQPRGCRERPEYNTTSWRRQRNLVRPDPPQVGFGSAPKVLQMRSPAVDRAAPAAGSRLSGVELAVVWAACLAVHVAALPWPLARALPLGVGVVAVAVWAVRQACGAPPPVRLDRALLGLVLWFTWSAACIPAAGDGHLAIHRVIWHGLAACAWIIAWRSGPEAARQLAGLLALSGGAAAALGLALWGLGVTPGQVCYVLRDQNTLGAHLALVTPLAAWRAWCGGPRRGLYVAAALLCLGGTLATGSRGAVLGLALAGAVACALAGGLDAAARAARLRVVLGASVALLVPALAFSAVSDPAQSSSMPHRLFMWATCGRVVRESPLFGAGPGNFRLAYQSHRPRGSRDSYALAIPADAHSDTMDALAETGIPGALLLGGLVWLSVAPALRRAAGEGRGMAVAASAAIIGWCANGLLNSSLANPATEPTCLLALGLAAAARAPSPLWAVPRRLAWTVPLLALALLSVAGQRTVRTAWAWSVASRAGLSPEYRPLLRGGEPPTSAQQPVQPGTAVGALRQATRIDPEHNALWQLLGAVAAGDDPGLARAALQHSVELVPSYAGSHHALGLLLAREGDRGGAEQELQAAVSLDPYNPYYRIDLAECMGPEQRFAALRNLAMAAQLLLMTQEVVTARFGPASREAEAVDEGFERVKRVRRRVMGQR